MEPLFAIIGIIALSALLVGAITHSIDLRLSYKGQVTEWNADQSAGQEINISEPVPGSSTDLQINCAAVDVTAMKALYMKATGGDLTIETNNGATPDETISLVDGKPIIWYDGCGWANPITTDITTNIFVTEAAADDVTLDVYILQDPTP